MSLVPQTLFNMNMFVNGQSMQGDVLSMTLPKFKVKTEALRAGGMDAEIDMDMGLEKGECSWSMSGIRKEVLRYFGLSDGSAFSGAFRGTFQDAKGAKTGVIVTVRGRVTEVDPGDWKPGEKAEVKYNLSLTYYKLELAGEVIYEIDPVNMIRIVDGVDQLEEHRANLGL